MNRRFSIVAPVLVLLIAALTLPASALTVGAVTGVVRDAKGTPQIGTLVQLLRPDLTVITQTFTDDHGHYELPRILPGVYGVKATGDLFLPTLRENLYVAASSKLVVNLTLSTLYEAFRWLPAKPRASSEPTDDWTWTLRLSANRPLLRMLEDGPLLVVTEANGANAALKARVTVRGGESTFGDGGVHNGFEWRRSPDDSRQMIFRADVGQSEDTSLNTLIGYQQELGPGRTLRTVGAFVDRPAIGGGPDAQGMQAMVIRTSEVMEFGPGLTAEFGSEMEGVRLGNTLLSQHPFAGVRVQTGEATSVTYRVTTAPGLLYADSIDRPSSLPPLISERAGQLRQEHGLHQQIAIENVTGNLHSRLTVFHDHVQNPMIHGGGTISSADWKQGNYLYDSSTGMLAVSGQDFSGAGVLAEVKEMLPNDMWIGFDAGMGNVLSLASSTAPLAVSSNTPEFRARNAGSYSASFGGKLQHGTQWRASYRWQQPDTLTQVTPFNTYDRDPYLSFYLRQPIRYKGVLPNGIDALIDVRNLLAQGYLPFLTSDGSILYFAQASRSIEGGISFSF